MTFKDLLESTTSHSLRIRESTLERASISGTSSNRRGAIFGDAVNVASRIEPLSEDGGVCLTRHVYESTRNKFGVSSVSMGMKTLKNVSEPMEIYKMELPWTL